MRQIAAIGFISGTLLFFGTAAFGDLILYYDFDHPDPNYVFDQSGYGHDGQLVADTEAGDPAAPLPPSTEPNWIAGVYGGGMQFCAGTNNYNSVWIPRSDSLADLGTRWSFAMWLRQDSRACTPGGGYCYPRVISSWNYEIELGVSGDEKDYFWPSAHIETQNKQWQTAIGTSYIGDEGSLGQWYHMAVVYDGTYLMKYINGSLVIDSVVALADKTIGDEWEGHGGGDPLKLACQSWPNKDWFIGAMDDVAIWSYGHLDADAVAGLYNGTYTPLTVPFVVAPPPPPLEPEITPPSYLFNSTFIYEYPNGIVLEPDQYEAPWSPWNWHIDDASGVDFAYGIQNVSLWDGGEPNYVYAAYVTVGVDLHQEANPSEGAWQPIREGIEYNLKARVAGYNAVGNRIKIEFYKASQTDPNDYELIVDPNVTSVIITENQVWEDISATYISDAADDNKYFKVVACLEPVSGPAEGTWAYFDSIVIDVEGPVNCTGVINLGLLDAGDFDQDCEVTLSDLETFAGMWLGKSVPEPRTTATELLDNPDFYEDIDLVPDPGSSAAAVPSGWQFVPNPMNAANAGIWNLADQGVINSPYTGDYQAAGGSVAVYIDPNTVLQQIADTPISNGTKYYLSAMVAGVASSYQNIMRVTWEYVDHPVSPTTSTVAAVRDFVLPGPDNSAPLWRKLTAEYTADASAAGKYFRVKGRYMETLGPAEDDWGLVGYVSIDTVKPAEWPRTNLLTNGDFEEVSNLSTNDQLLLEATHNGWINHGSNPAGDPGNYSPWPPGWTYGNGRGQGYEPSTSNGLQCMLWAPPGQPVQGRIQEITTDDPTVHVTGGRVSIWLDANYPDLFGIGEDGPVSMIYQKVDSPTIQEGTTYYLDFTAASSWASVNEDPALWPDTDPNFTVELFWVAPGQNGLAGTQGTDWDYITRAVAFADNNMGAAGGTWQVGQAAFTADSSQAGKHFFVRAFGSFPYAAFEEIFLSGQPRPRIGAYTCYELNDQYGAGIAADLDGNCIVNLEDLGLFAIEWLDCVDPAGCP